ncbi:MAG: hypothetical protein GTO45_00670 [Candidatus Aminicenantes bacterium]|nr:hypothetical protein [Candidatus Aminicenantes bacterium]NIM77275.1 hypothetical protein [Candidatus Aminicenantes bacterium]NIN16576.1 hypothetical protein [Candidatus Aminicenantes bacterium]NIN40434.1 hypothetical protein [Candidatus Aminicenantes bacterium]NIN83254.1 hypothetical protein [Candidatus Aminicenantes bacterium]
MADAHHSNEIKSQFLQYLPEIYREEGPAKELLARFLCIFETVFNSLDETISRIPTYFDPTTAPGDFIPWLAQWFSLDLYELLGEKNREFILRAVEFYRQKGTVKGLEELASFLTGKKCRVKEYTKNVFRTSGMERCDGSGMVTGHVTMSGTVDTSDRRLLTKMGSFEDDVHYLTDTNKNSRYFDNVIGLFIFLAPEDKDFLIKRDQLHKILNSFLPVFVRLEIFIVEESCRTEVYNIGVVEDKYNEHVHVVSAEQSPGLQGVYKDHVNWNKFRTNDPGKGITNDPRYRVPNMDIDKEFNI